MADILQTVKSVLSSPSARKIDFHLGLIHVNAAGLAAIHSLVSVGGAGGIRIDAAAVMKKGTAAEYDNATNTLRFPRGDYGATVREKAHILHECVHALQDAFGGRHLHPLGGSRFTTASENEAAAYVAGSLYHLYETGKKMTGKPTQYYWADAIAQRILNQRGAFVSTAEATDLRTAIVNSRVYTIGFSTLSAADGL